MKHVMTPEFRMQALCNDEATGEFFFRVVFRNVDGAMVPLDVARSKIGNRKSLVETLRNAGAFFHEDDTLNDGALDRLVRSQSTAKRITFARATGWRDDGKLFVTPGEVIGANDGPSRILPPREETEHLQIERQGSLAGWKQHVAEPARMSSRLAFAICLGLAAPLLRRTELHSYRDLAPCESGGQGRRQRAGCDEAAPPFDRGLLVGRSLSPASRAPWGVSRAAGWSTGRAACRRSWKASLRARAASSRVSISLSASKPWVWSTHMSLMIPSSSPGHAMAIRSAMSSASMLAPATEPASSTSAGKRRRCGHVGACRETCSGPF
jgi:hypothetical protein